MEDPEVIQDEAPYEDGREDGELEVDVMEFNANDDQLVRTGGDSYAEQAPAEPPKKKLPPGAFGFAFVDPTAVQLNKAAPVEKKKPENATPTELSAVKLKKAAPTEGSKRLAPEDAGKPEWMQKQLKKNEGSNVRTPVGSVLRTEGEAPPQQQPPQPQQVQQPPPQEEEEPPQEETQEETPPQLTEAPTEAPAQGGTQEDDVVEAPEPTPAKKKKRCIIM
jgi:hypothetical protein